MASTDYTDKQLAEHMDTLTRERVFPANSIFDPGAERRGEPILRKLTPAETRHVAPVKTDADSTEKEG